METLIESLKQFEEKANTVSNETELQSIFKELAPAFLYGGYILVHDEYKVFIRTVEFYFHSEKENGIHDPIVYHRNGKDFANVPYFPLMTLHAHSSGFDITFESEAEQYRASALIRTYEVKDKDGKYLVWNKENSMFEETTDYGYNAQSTYLYALLNGFSLGNSNNVKWIDAPRKQSSSAMEKKRQNVYQFDSERNKVKCNRNWSFTRIEQV
jgi:hypothetical protein